MTKAELEKQLEMTVAERDQLIEELRAVREGGGSLGNNLVPSATLEQTGYLEPLLLGACIGALRNPMTGVAYDEAEFQAYAPKFIDQAIRLHNMAMARLNTMEENKVPLMS